MNHTPSHDAFTRKINLYEAMDEQRRVERKLIWNHRVKAFCIAVAVFSIVYIGGHVLWAVVL